MKMDYMIHTDEGYKLAQEQARQYFSLLKQDLQSKTYQSILYNDLQIWKQNHTHRPSLLSLFTRKGTTIPSKLGSYQYIHNLHASGKLEKYLERSIFYVFLRDLAKDVESPETLASVKHAVQQINKQLTKSIEMNLQGDEFFSMAWLYRLAQKYHVEITVIWLMDKLKAVSTHIPESMDPEKAMVKIFKIIAGVVIHQVVEWEAELTPEERTVKLEQAIRLGYAYGITYPFIDDLLDSSILSIDEEKKFTHMVQTALITGRVPAYFDWKGPNQSLVRFIYAELKSSFEYIDNHLPYSVKDKFFQQAFIFFQAQEDDRNRDLSFAYYENEHLYVPVILKSAYSRIIAHSIIGTDIDEDRYGRTFYFGLYNQLSDDFRDLFKDLEENRVTPFTYYLKYHGEREDLINPYELYWTVVNFLIHDVYESNKNVATALLSRAINGQRRLQSHFGEDKYKEIIKWLTPDDSQFFLFIQRLIRDSKDTDFFDQYVSDQFYLNHKMEGKTYRDFIKDIETIRQEINTQLHISSNGFPLEENISNAANYSLKSGGKRLRPILAWLMGQRFGLKKQTLIQLVKSLEFMHTASLIFDDLPTQDNASIRRGRPTLHRAFNEYTAELTGLFLTQKAVEEQTFIKEHDPKTVLELIRYSTQAAADMCKGQVMDLDSKGKQLSIEELHTMSFYKTGIGFEVPLVMPAILAKASESELKALKKFSRYLGIAFQIKDDLLDLEGDEDILGKDKGKDAGKHHATFVTVLGVEGAKKEMWEQYCLAMETLKDLPKYASFLRHLVNYVVYRDH